MRLDTAEPSRRRRAGARRGRGRAAAAVALAVGLTACSSSGDDGGRPEGEAASPSDGSDRWVYPGVEWDHVDPATAGFDQAALDRLAAEAEAAGSSCMVVTRDGAVVDERYWNGASAETPRESFSVTKSVTSTLVGIAQDQGALSTTDPAADHIPAWRGTDAEAVTIEDVLSNDSGRHWDLGTDYGQMALQAEDKTDFAIGLAQDTPPGEIWAYNNSAIQTLSAVLQDATGEPAADFAKEVLFDRIGMAHSSLGADAAGNTLTFMGLQTTCLDLARFGYLMMRDGAWEGDQVVSSDYVEQATGPASTPLNAAYGWLWWLNHEGPTASPRVATGGAGDDAATEGPIVPGAPDDAYWALGFNNQILAVVPSEGVVAVRLGRKPPEGVAFTEAELTTGVLGALAQERG